MLLLRRIVGDRDRRARLAERERDVAAREAVVEERARIARELHDAVAHSVSMMVIQAGAERRVIEDGSTREVLQTIEQIGRGALTEMRRLVGMLRTESSSAAARAAADAGRPADAHDAGPGGRAAGGVHASTASVASCPSGIELSAYRIVQEALTNALKHAGRAHASVGVRYGPDSLELEIADDGAGDSAPMSRVAGTAWPASASGSACTGASSTRPPASAAASPSACCCRCERRPHDDAADRRRSGAGPGRPAQDPGERAADHRGGRRPATARTRSPPPGGSARRGPHGHPHAGPGRDRGDPPDRAAPSPRRGC